jgi:hypothetical protein
VILTQDPRPFLKTGLHNRFEYSNASVIHQSIDMVELGHYFFDRIGDLIGIRNITFNGEGITWFV